MKKVINMLSASHSMLFSYIYQRVSGVKIRGSKPSKVKQELLLQERVERNRNMQNMNKIIISEAHTEDKLSDDHKII